MKSSKARKSLYGFLDDQGLKAKELSVEELEDLGLLMLMLEADRTKTVSRDTIMRKLSR
ncbi:MAG: hypothetical protein IPI07_01120 [Flavobacteriales bacterium]|nr:hypothetical protein [Flavobacteriales bacterium]